MTENLDTLSVALNGVEGWLTLQEARALHDAARSARPPDGTPPIVAEIGSYKGRSTIAIALGLLEQGEGMLYAIDPHTGSQEHRNMAAAPIDTGAEFVHNVKRAGVMRVVEMVRRYSHDARPLFADRSLSLLFVDGSHEYADVVQDIADWTSALADGAMIAFNDPGWPGVNRALRELVAIRKTPFRQPRFVRNTVFFRYQLGAAWGQRDVIALAALRVGLLYAGLKHTLCLHLPRPVLLTARAALHAVRGA